MKSILSWDADGVIFDGTMKILARVFGESLHLKYGIPIEQGTRYMYDTTGTPTATQYRNFLSERTLLPSNPTEADALIAGLVKDFTEDAYAEMPSLCPDVMLALPYLKGRKMAISTNAPQAVLDRRVRYHGLDEYFHSWFGKTEETPDKKQHKVPIMRLFQVTGDEFTRYGALIGDGYKDMEIAKEWEILGIGRKTEDNTEEGLMNAGAIAVVRDLRELPELLNRLFG